MTVREGFALRRRVAQWVVGRPAFLRRPIWLLLHLFYGLAIGIGYSLFYMGVTFVACLADLRPLLDAPRGQLPRLPSLPPDDDDDDDGCDCDFPHAEDLL